MLSRWVTFLVWAAVAASALAWGLKLAVVAPAAPPQTVVAAADTVARGDLTRLLGADAPPPASAVAAEPAADARFNLLGVVSPRAPKAGAEGLALIAVDGKPAKAFRVGAVVEGSNVLLTVAARGATLGPRGGPTLIALSIAPPAPATTGVLPAPGAALPTPAPAGGLPVLQQGLPQPVMPAPMPPQRMAPPPPPQVAPDEDPAVPVQRRPRAGRANEAQR